MTIQRNNFEGGTAGSATGTSASGGTAFTAADATIAYGSTYVAHGSLGAEFTGAATATGGLRYALDSPTVAKLVLYIQTTGAQTADLDFLRLSITGDTTAVTARINSANRLRLTLPGSVFPWTATADFPTNTSVRVELWADSAAGSARLSAYAGDSTTPITGLDSGIVTGINVGNSAAYVNGRYGKLNGNSLVGTLRFDDAASYTGSTDAVSTPTPFTAPAPVVSAGANQTLSTTGGTANLSGTATPTSGATVSSVTWSVLEKPAAAGTVSITGASSLTGASASLTTPGRYTFRLSVTDSNGQTGIATTKAFVPAAGVGSVSVLEVTTAGGWTGSVSALADSDDATYLESPTTNAVLVLRLNPLAVPTSFEIDPRASLSPSGTGTLKFELLQGATVRKDWGTVSLTTTAATSALTLTTAEINAITDWTELDLRVSWVTP